MKYAQNLVKTGPSEAVFNECKEVGALKFKVLEKEDPMDSCIGHARNLPKFTSE